MSKQLKILVGDEVMLDAEVDDASVEWNYNWEEIRSNPALAAAMAGAPPEALKDLPGEQVAYYTDGADVVVTYRLRFRGAKGHITDFHPAP